MASGRPKEEFCLSAESRKRTYPKSYFLQKYRKNRKRLFLPKDPLSAEIASFGREKLFFWPTFGSKFLPKDCLSAEIASSCRKSLFLQKDRKAQKLQKDFLPNFCRNSAEMHFRSTTRIIYCRCVPIQRQTGSSKIREFRGRHMYMPPNENFSILPNYKGQILSKYELISCQFMSFSTVSFVLQMCMITLPL